MKTQELVTQFIGRVEPRTPFALACTWSERFEDGRMYGITTVAPLLPAPNDSEGEWVIVNGSEVMLVSAYVDQVRLKLGDALMRDREKYRIFDSWASAVEISWRELWP